MILGSIPAASQQTLVCTMLFQSSCNNGYAEVGRWSVANIAIWIEIADNSLVITEAVTMDTKTNQSIIVKEGWPL